MKKLQIQSFLPVFNGFYNTFFSPDCEDSMMDTPEYEGMNWEDFNWDYEDYLDRVAKACVEAVQDKLLSEGFDIKISFEGLKSPKYYNYSNDSINVTFELSKKTFTKILKELNENSEDFADYVKTHYSSRSGLIAHIAMMLATGYLSTYSPILRRLYIALVLLWNFFWLMFLGLTIVL